MFAKRLVRPLSLCAALVSAAFIAGCAQSPTKPDSTARASTLSDAQEHAQGGRDPNKNPSQWSFGFDNKKPATTTTHPEVALASGQVRELLQTRTFLGTVACAATSSNCTPIRLVVTLSPDGVWRMRANDAEQNSAPIVNQGCWHQIGAVPTRILLQTQNDTVLADLSFMHDQQIRINVFNYVRPTLETHLSRQPEIDSISELENQTGPICRR